MEKSLDRKIQSIHADPAGSKEFIIADAKDADMAFGIGAPGLSPERHDQELKYKTLAEYRDQIREVISQEVVDIVLMSASTSEKLTIDERLFDKSPITPAARANDTTDVHVPRGGVVHLSPAKPFRSASLDHIQCGHLDCKPEERAYGADLGLYSVTFNNNLEEDLRTLERYKEFREEAERKKFRHFLEIFDPNISNAVAADLAPGFINDLIARTLAGVASAGRPTFLKMVYHGPRAMEELVAYDPHLIVGILGGSAGTTLDAFQLIYDARKYGARVALFGRKINQAEHQLAFIQFLRYLVEDKIQPVEAVHAYHGVLQELGIKPTRSLDVDLTYQTAVMSYGGEDGKTFSFPSQNKNGKPAANSTGKPAQAKSAQNANGTPDFAAMNSEQKLAYHQDRLNRMFGQ